MKFGAEARELIGKLDLLGLNPSESFIDFVEPSFNFRIDERLLQP